MADGVQVDFQPCPAAVLLGDGCQLFGVELHVALRGVNGSGVGGSGFLVVAVVLERAAHLVGRVGSCLAIGQVAVRAAARRGLDGRGTTGMGGALRLALANGVRGAFRARLLAEREAGESVGELCVVCHVLYPLEPFRYPPKRDAEKADQAAQGV